MDLQVRGSLTNPWQRILRVRDGKLTPPLSAFRYLLLRRKDCWNPAEYALANCPPAPIKANSTAAASSRCKIRAAGDGLAIAAKQWPAINTQQYQMEVDGAAKIDGTLAAPRITGKFEVPEVSCVPI